MDKETENIFISNDIEYLKYIFENEVPEKRFDAGRMLYKELKNTGNLSAGILVLQDLIRLKASPRFLKRELEICRDKLELLNDENFIKNNVQSIDKMIYPSEVEKVLHVLNTSVPYLNNGYSIRSKYIIESQKKTLIEPVVLTRPGFPKDFNINLNFQDKEIIKEQYNEITYYRCLPELFMRHTPLKKYLMEYSKQIDMVIEWESPNILHSASNYVNGLATLISSRKRKIPFIYEIRGFWEMTTASKEPLFNNSEEFRLARKMETYLANKANLVITISNGLKKELTKRGVDGNKIHIIPNGVDCSKLKEVGYNKVLGRKYNLLNKFVIGYIGSITKYEGLQSLLKVLALLKVNGIVNIKFFVAGIGLYLETLKEMIYKLGLEGDVVFAGSIPHEEVSEYYSLFDLCVFPRINEEVSRIVTPLKPLEAMACGKTVLVSDLDALREIVIPGINGFIFDGSEEDLYKKVKMLYEVEKLRCNIKPKARKWVEKNRDWSYLSENLKKTYENLVIKTYKLRGRNK